MARQTFFWKLFTYFILLLSAASGIFGLILYRSIYNNNLIALKDNLRRQTLALSEIVANSNDILNNPVILTSAVHYEDRITVMSLDGTVLADNWAQRIGKQEIENHSDRPEFQAAMQGKPIFVNRLSETLSREMIYYAVPVKQRGKTILVLRLSFPMTDIAEQNQSLRNLILTAALMTLLLSLPFIYLLSRHMTLAVQTIRLSSQKIAKGDLSQRVPIVGPREFQDLAKDLNSMAGELQQKITTIEEEHSRLQTLLSGMVEGVLAIDHSGHAVFANAAFCKMTGSRMERIEGKSFLEITRNDDLSTYISQLLNERTKSPETQVADSQEIRFFQSGQERIFSVQASRVYGTNGWLSLILLVFHDVTAMRLVEQVRKDFVANVSHELRTPLTAIQGSTEVLLDGAYRDPVQAKRFLEIMDKQLKNIQNLVVDMLKLASVEDARFPLRRERTNLSALVRDVVTVIEPLANKKNQKLEVDVSPKLPEMEIDSLQISDALLNLLDNAVKYTREGGRIQLRATIDGNDVLFAVSDNGIGIPKEQLPRVFERFYRIDKSRSREIGGTGLGLSIVKHTVENHGGTITVESQPGDGTTFTIRIPAPVATLRT